MNEFFYPNPKKVNFPTSGSKFKDFRRTFSTLMISGSVSKYLKFKYNSMVDDSNEYAIAYNNPLTTNALVAEEVNELTIKTHLTKTQNSKCFLLIIDIHENDLDYQLFFNTIYISLKNAFIKDGKGRYLTNFFFYIKKKVRIYIILNYSLLIMKL